jgi:hypothetical protein
MSLREETMPGKLKIGGVCRARLIEGPDGITVLSPASPYVERMATETREEDRIILASCALRKDPTCIVAHLLLSRYAPDQDTRFQHLKVAVEAGDSLWGPLAEKQGSPLMCWKFPAMKPYMRAIQYLGDALAPVGNNTAAEFSYSRLESMSPAYGSVATARSGMAM